MNEYAYIERNGAKRSWFRYHFLEQKLNTPIGYCVFGLLALGCAFCTTLIDMKIGLAYLGVFVAVFLIAMYFRNPYFGLYFTIFFSSLPTVLSRLIPSADIPFGTFTDVLAYLLLFSVLFKYKFRASVDKKLFFNPITIALLGLLFFYIIQIANPNMFSKLGWFSYTRKFFMQLCVFFCCYCLFNSWKRVKHFIYFWIIFTTVLAAYACKQQWFGLADFEWQWLNAHPKQFDLILQWGLLRKFSIFSDPASSGIYFASVAAQCIILIIREPKFGTKFWLGVAAMFNLLGYAYSGTRTATLMVVVAIFVYCVATAYEKRTIIFGVLCVLGFLVFMYMPFSPPWIGRVRSTFTGTKDASAAIRDFNRHRVQPYLYDHPMGGGIFTSIPEGTKYNTGHYLEKFPPDSGYMKIFAEQGWIGLGLTLMCYYIFLRRGIKNYYRLRNPDIQNHALALIILLFTLMIGQYSQIAMGIDPETFYYLGILVIFIKLPFLDNMTPAAQTRLNYEA